MGTPGTGSPGWVRGGTGAVTPRAGGSVLQGRSPAALLAVVVGNKRTCSWLSAKTNGIILTFQSAALYAIDEKRSAGGGEPRCEQNGVRAGGEAPCLPEAGPVGKQGSQSSPQLPEPGPHWEALPRDGGLGEPPKRGCTGTAPGAALLIPVRPTSQPGDQEYLIAGWKCRAVWGSAWQSSKSGYATFY